MIHLVNTQGLSTMLDHGYSNSNWLFNSFFMFIIRIFSPVFSPLGLFGIWTFYSLTCHLDWGCDEFTTSHFVSFFSFVITIITYKLIFQYCYYAYNLMIVILIFNLYKTVNEKVKRKTVIADKKRVVQNISSGIISPPAKNILVNWYTFLPPPFFITDHPSIII